MKFFYYTIAFTILIAVCSVSCRQQVPVKVFSGEQISISDSLLQTTISDTLYFGRVRRGETVEKQFSILNKGAIPFTIINFDVDCGCITFEFNRDVVQPEQEKIVTVRFNSAGYYGEVYKKARLRTSLSEATHNIIVGASVD